MLPSPQTHSEGDTSSLGSCVSILRLVCHISCCRVVTLATGAQALKKARQFEVGKLKRRLKAAAEGAERSKLETQLTALAKVDLECTAQQVSRVPAM